MSYLFNYLKELSEKHEEEKRTESLKLDNFIINVDRLYSMINKWLQNYFAAGHVSVTLGGENTERWLEITIVNKFIRFISNLESSDSYVYYIDVEGHSTFAFLKKYNIWVIVRPDITQLDEFPEYPFAYEKLDEENFTAFIIATFK